jgi:hypothetical protein
MAEEKGSKKTTPTPEFEWLLNSGSLRGVMVSTSNPIPDETTTQPPHVETYHRYAETADSLDAELVVTMEHPSRKNPQKLIIEIGNYGPVLKKPSASASSFSASRRSPRMG